jgi:nickel superoxide dismutase
MTALSLAVLLQAAPLFAHCEVPCGIYEDNMRIEMIYEHITTIEKSMKKVTELSAEGEKNYNQIVRWVNNKDTHATKLQHIVNQYFMTQRIKPVEPSNGDAYEKYLSELEMLHQMLVLSMKCKQTTDQVHVDRLRAVTADFRDSYLGEDAEHTH